MNSRRLGALLLALAAFAAAPAASAEGISGAARAFRGDIVIIKGTKVALFGLSAPTDGESCAVDAGTVPCADAARDALAALLAPGPVTCDYVRKTGHGAYQGRCRDADTPDIGLALLSAGWARTDAEAPADYRAAEADAKSAQRGLWAAAP